MSGGGQMARMGEYAVSRDPEDRLTALGLGSCIGLALVDRRTGVAGLAHIVLPVGTPLETDPPVKYAPTAVPYLIERLVALGARRNHLRAVMVGGASMFAASSKLEVGARNAAVVRELLERSRIQIAAAATGGKRGRTIRVYVGEGRVTSRVAGSAEEDLVAAASVMAFA